MKELHQLSALEIGKLVRERVISPTQVVSYFADRIEQLNPTINAFTYTRIPQALEAARYLERKIKRNERLGVFAGVPFALKDFLPSKKGWTHSYGGVPCLANTIDNYDSEFCRAMEAADGIAIGKTNAPAFGYRGVTDNVMYGPTRNPYNLEYNSGGSSGGSAAAVAAGMVPIAEGGDAGGSIRIPAAWCNCVGFKPSAGLIPSVCRPDGWAATHPFCCNGGITKTVEDTVVLFDLMTGYNRRDPYSVPNLQHPKIINKPRIGWTHNFDLFNTAPEIKIAVTAVVETFRTAGADVRHTPFEFNYTLRELADAWYQGLAIDSAIEFREWRDRGEIDMQHHLDEIPSEFVKWVQKADQLDIHWMYHFNKVRTDVLDAFVDTFEHVDFIIAPVTACGPIKNTPGQLTAAANGDIIEFGETFLLNFIGFPAISIPAGFDVNGLPIGVQIIGPRYSDRRVLEVAEWVLSQLRSVLQSPAWISGQLLQDLK